MLRWNRFTGLAMALVATGCFNGGGSDGCVPANANGLVGNGAFSYVCRSGADQACVDASTMAPLGSLPSAVARGASFGLQYDGRTGSMQTVAPVSARTVVRESGFFRTTRAGTVGFLVEDGAEVVDAVRLAFVEPTRIDVPAATESFGAALQVGSVYTFLAVPYGPVAGGEQRLAGSLPVTWTTDSGLELSEPGLVSFVPPRPGRVVLLADFEGRVSGQISLLVVGRALEGPPDASTGDAATSDDAGVDGGAP